MLALSKDSAPVLRYAEAGSTNSEIADMLGIEAEDLAAFEAPLRKGRALLRWRIRKALLTSADQHTPVALTYLAATYLAEGAAAPPNP